MGRKPRLKVAGLDTSGCPVPADHELNLVDVHLNLPVGTTYRTVVLHGDPAEFNSASPVQLGRLGFVPRESRAAWRSLMVVCGVGTAFWMDHSTGPTAEIKSL